MDGEIGAGEQRKSESVRFVLLADVLFEKLLAAYEHRPYLIEYGKPDEHGYYAPLVTLVPEREA